MGTGTCTLIHRVTEVVAIIVVVVPPPLRRRCLCAVQHVAEALVYNNPSREPASTVVCP